MMLILKMLNIRYLCRQKVVKKSTAIRVSQPSRGDERRRGLSILGLCLFLLLSSFLEYFQKRYSPLVALLQYINIHKLYKSQRFRVVTGVLYVTFYERNTCFVYISL